MYPSYPSVPHVRCIFQSPFLPLLFTHALTDRTPSDAGLEGVWDAVPVWGRLAVKLGVPISTVESLQQNPIGCLKAFQLWQSGRYRDKGFPPTWSFLLDAVEEISGPLIREKIADKVATERTWTD